MLLSKAFKENLKKARKNKKLTQKDVAEKLGLHWTRILNYEKTGNVTLELAQKLADAIGVPLKELLYPSQNFNVDSELLFLINVWPTLKESQRGLLMGEIRRWAGHTSGIIDVDKSSNKISKHKA